MTMLKINSLFLNIQKPLVCKMKRILLITIILISNYFLFIPLGTSADKELLEEKKIAIEGKYRNVILGMNRKEVLDIIKSDSHIEVDDYTDYGEFDEEQNYLIKAKRPPFIEHIYYQFTKKKLTLHDKAKPNIKDDWVLYAIIIKFSLRYNSYFSLYNRILSKYGEADIRTSKFSIWNTKNRELFKAKKEIGMPVRLILNNPTTIKIIDEKTYLEKTMGRKRDKQDLRSYQQELNDKLLDDFSPPKQK